MSLADRASDLSHIACGRGLMAGVRAGVLLGTGLMLWLAAPTVSLPQALPIGVRWCSTGGDDASVWARSWRESCSCRCW